MTATRPDAPPVAYVPTSDAARSVNEATRSAQQDAVLTPRFYTTDFEELDRLQVDRHRELWDELVAEFRRDPNKDHFKRSPEFDADFSAMPPELREQFIRSHS
jgi:magnesium-protoporphyrin IX monomethyl ester (oxidative) cyclase